VVICPTESENRHPSLAAFPLKSKTKGLEFLQLIFAPGESCKLPTQLSMMSPEFLFNRDEQDKQDVRTEL
jgi:hypothetical protein